MPLLPVLAVLTEALEVDVAALILLTLVMRLFPVILKINGTDTRDGDHLEDKVDTNKEAELTSLTRWSTWSLVRHKWIELDMFLSG